MQLSCACMITCLLLFICPGRTTWILSVFSRWCKTITFYHCETRWDSDNCNYYTTRKIYFEAFVFELFHIKLEHLFAGEKGLIAYWDTDTWKKVGAQVIEKNPISAFSISSDGKFLAT
jgi:hypothetical protein